MARPELTQILREAEARIDRQPLPARLADEIRKLILIGDLPPQSALTERDMADLLGVSRTPLREALRILSNEGLVDITPNRGPRVADPSLEEITQLLEVQGVLEALAGELCIAVASDVQLAEIHRLHEQMVEISDSSDPLDFFNLDMRFHTRIVEASRNAPLLQTHAIYNARLYRARFISSRRQNGRPTTLAQHGEIAAALSTRDVERARAALRIHLRSTAANIAAIKTDPVQ